MQQHKRKFRKFYQKKTLGHYFDDIVDNKKRFEVRQDMLDLQVGDFVQLLDTSSMNGNTYKKSIVVEVEYILNHNQLSNLVSYISHNVEDPERLVIFSFRILSDDQAYFVSRHHNCKLKEYENNNFECEVHIYEGNPFDSSHIQYGFDARKGMINNWFCSDSARIKVKGDLPLNVICQDCHLKQAKALDLDLTTCTRCGWDIEPSVELIRVNAGSLYHNTCLYFELLEEVHDLDIETKYLTNDPSAFVDYQPTPDHIPFQFYECEKCGIEGMYDEVGFFETIPICGGEE